MKATAMNSANPVSRIERRKQGKALRERCSRAAQAEWKPGAKPRDPIGLLEESDIGRDRSLIPLKYQRMAESPFKFFRGSAIIQARDLATTPVSGLTVQACGDCHLMNFGGFASPERTLVFDINDFDETFPGAWEWDLKRLGASLVLAARDRGFSKAVAEEVVRSASASYRTHMAEFAEMKALDVWYSQVSINDLKKHFFKNSAMFSELSKKHRLARSQTSEAVFPKLTTVVDGHVRIKDDPPLLYHFQQNHEDFEKDKRSQFADYRKSLQADRLELLDRYRYQDSAVKVVGVGSVGTRCYVSLFLSDDREPLFLQIKEARRSVLERPRRKSRFDHQGFRVVTGQRLMQAASDIFLGWFSSRYGRDYYVRQFRDMKISPEAEAFRPATLTGYAFMCGWAVARAHAKSGDAAMIAGYLGPSAAFDNSLVQYSKAYADQTERDFASFQAAILSGRLSTEPEKNTGLDFLK